jgi:dihydroorotate dehydrogenase electron transfer subunit
MTQKPTYPDSLWRGTVELVEQEQVAERTYRIRFSAPQLAAAVLPGQFVMVRLPDGTDPLLGRPLAVYRVGDDGMVDLIYLVVGKMTGLLCHRKPGTKLEVWGPLGNGFSDYEVDHLILVAGGIGQTPFLSLSQERLGQRRFGNPHQTVQPVAKISLCYGARTEKYLAALDDFREVGVDLKIATEDGSAGQKGLVTELIEPLVVPNEKTQIIACGPKRMLAAVIEEANRLGLPSDVSLESPMACGMGICFSCVAKVRDEEGGDWDYRRTCVDGPVFNGKLVVLDD